MHLFVVEKTFEKYVAKILKNLFKKFNRKHNPIWLQKGKNTEKLMVEVNDYLNNCFNMGSGQITIIYLTISRALVIFEHARLIRISEHIGFSGVYLKLFDS